MAQWGRRTRSDSRPYPKGGHGAAHPRTKARQTFAYPKHRITTRYGFDETESSFRVRQKPPSEFQEDSFRTIDIGSRGVKAVVGRPKGQNTTQVQSYIFPKEQFKTKAEVRAWIRQNQ